MNKSLDAFCFSTRRIRRRIVSQSTRARCIQKKACFTEAPKATRVKTVCGDIKAESKDISRALGWVTKAIQRNVAAIYLGYLMWFPTTMQVSSFSISVFQYVKCHSSSYGTQIARYLSTLQVYDTIIRLRYSRECPEIPVHLPRTRDRSRWRSRVVWH